MCNTVHADVEDTQATGYTVVMDDRAGWYGFGWERGTTMHSQGMQPVRLHDLGGGK